ncbi:Uncharacterized protein APZ42_020035 [Daphnia magna]|uniref:Uncharacterized protein n=1 Tax=Daphnia magna TaxID=35525 RepID=A0A164XY10_9CRUS|nr:Uncharacterized protein APZ42_020035 [Daphnia magna]
MQSRTCFPSPTSGLEDAEYNEPDMSANLNGHKNGGCSRSGQTGNRTLEGQIHRQKDNFGFLVQTGTTTFPNSFLPGLLHTVVQTDKTVAVQRLISKKGGWKMASKRG